MKSYLITDPIHYSNKRKIFKKKLNIALKKNKISYACFRDKTTKNNKKLAKTFIILCKKYGIKKTYINSDYILAKKLGAHGVHLRSDQFNEIRKVKKLNLDIIISCHTHNDINLAKKYGITKITYSPIFYTPNKGKPKGIKNLKKTIKKFPNIKIIALGGIISNKEISLLKKNKIFAYSSIRYFTKKFN